MVISIHAPRGGSDIRPSRRSEKPIDFNPRSPWGERRKAFDRRKAQGDFNPRSPWGERPDFSRITKIVTDDFNPRSPWGERRQAVGYVTKYVGFQSTLPVGGATIFVG